MGTGSSFDGEWVGMFGECQSGRRELYVDQEREANERREIGSVASPGCRIAVLSLLLLLEWGAATARVER